MAKVEHLFVVMLENRSFDHMLGFSGIDGFDARTGRKTTIEGLFNLPVKIINQIQGYGRAPFAMDHDPQHEFLDTMEQLCGKFINYSGGPYPMLNIKTENNYEFISPDGFISNYYRKVDFYNQYDSMKCFMPDQLPVLNSLAKEFCVCDHWFSSIPGPTFPNRFFAHAASSGGLDDSYTSPEIGVLWAIGGCPFLNGAIFGLLNNNGNKWAIYHGDDNPQVNFIAGMKQWNGNFKSYDSFFADVQNPAYPYNYTFIEPHYGHVLTRGTYLGGTSQHPIDDVRSGEWLLKNIYEAIRKSPVWEESALIITWDEHGGFYDHVPPPGCASPKDAISLPINNKHAFGFDQLGVRVPAVIVSPLIPKNIIDKEVHDHSAIPATVESLFSIGGALTQRDRLKNNNLDYLFSLQTPRTDTPEVMPPTSLKLKADYGKGTKVTGALAALIALGYTEADAKRALKKADMGLMQGSLEERVQSAIRLISCSTLL